MSILTWMRQQKEKKEARLLAASGKAEPLTPENSLYSKKQLWIRCENCGAVLYISHLQFDSHTCKDCGDNIKIDTISRIENLIDPQSWRPLYELLSAGDPLQFKDKKTYEQRLADSQESTGFQDAIEVGTGLLGGNPVALGIMTFDFMGGSMGSVVGEKIARLIEYATRNGMMLMLISASGGARMQEGTLSLMQMAKISGALFNHQCCAKLFFISLIASPTTGGVTASFAMLGDVIIAEPKAVIGFAGRRVIEQTLRETLPDEFQTAEYLIEHGLVDLILGRKILKTCLTLLLKLNYQAVFRRAGWRMA